jgi:hypothetical protein
MRKLIVLIPMLLVANSAMAYSGGEASEIVREGTVIAVERSGGEWNLLVDYLDVLFACRTVGVGIVCFPLE